MAKYLYILLFLFMLVNCSKKKTTHAESLTIKDSLLIYLNEANDETLLMLKRKKSTQKALSIVMNQSNDSMHRVYLLRVSNRYFNMGDYEGFESTVRLLLEKAQKVRDTAFIAKSYSYLGDYYGGIGITDSAYSYYFRAEKKYLLLDNPLELARNKLNKATLLYHQSNFLQAEAEVFNALRLIKINDKKRLYFDAYNLLGLIYAELEEYDKSLEYNQKAFASIDDNAVGVDYQSKAISLNNTGMVYGKMNNHKKAIDFFNRGLNQKNVVSNTDIYTLLLDNLAYSKFMSRAFEQLPELFYKSLKIRDSLGYPNRKITSLVHLSEYYSYEKDHFKALQFCKEALTTARESNNRRNVLEPLKQLAILDPKNAAKYTSEYVHISDSLQKVERAMGNKFTRIEYETDKIKDEYSDLEVQNRNLVYFFSGFIILVMFLYILKEQKTKTRELLYKEQQQQANEDIYNLIINQQSLIEVNRVEEKKRVAQELHDGVLGRMFGVRMNLDSLNRFNDDMAINQRNEYIVELKNIEQDIREISHDLNREKSELINNFVAIVDNLFDEQRKTFHLDLVSSIDVSIKWDLISNSIKINLFRIIQESIQNINKYAKAKVVVVEIKKIEENLRLIIKDDGIGFKTNLRKKGIGLQNMFSRTKDCKGKFNVKSKLGEGTEITVVIPIENQIPS